jgi:serine kinase of HPr protein (carbohydrate metabolism regulator)
MTRPSVSSETVHASCVAIDGCAVLISGRSGSGKSDLAIRLIDRGARLVSDDYTLVVRSGATLLARAPATISGRIEVRGVGVVAIEPVADVPVGLVADLDAAPERLPELTERRVLAGIALPVVAIAGLEASAPIKLEMALRMLARPAA